MGLGRHTLLNNCMQAQTLKSAHLISFKSASLGTIWKWLQGGLLVVDVVVHNSQHARVFVWVVIHVDHHRPQALIPRVMSDLAQQCVSDLLRITITEATS